MHGTHIEVEGVKQDLDFHSFIDMFWSMLTRAVTNYFIQIDTYEIPHSITYLPALNQHHHQRKLISYWIRQSAKAFQTLMNQAYIFNIDLGHTAIQTVIHIF